MSIDLALLWTNSNLRTPKDRDAVLEHFQQAAASNTRVNRPYFGTAQPDVLAVTRNAPVLPVPHITASNSVRQRRWGYNSRW